MPEKHVITEENAPRILEWLANRGGIAIWPSLDLSDPGKTWTSPVKHEDGSAVTRPHWSAATEPSRIITDPNDIMVSRDEIVKRFHVAIRMGAQGMKVKVTDYGSRRIRREVAKVGKGAYHTFDYDTQDALIWKPTEQYPLTEYKEKAA